MPKYEEIGFHWAFSNGVDNYSFVSSETEFYKELAKKYNCKPDDIKILETGKFDNDLGEVIWTQTLI